MRFMIIVKATADSEAGRWPEGSDELFEAMRMYHEDLARSGALLDAAGLHPSSDGWRIRHAASLSSMGLSPKRRSSSAATR